MIALNKLDTALAVCTCNLTNQMDYTVHGGTELQKYFFSNQKFYHLKILDTLGHVQ